MRLIRYISILVSFLCLLFCSGCRFFTTENSRFGNTSSATTKHEAPPIIVELKLNKKRVYFQTPPFELSGGTPPGGSYSGPGIDSSKFYPEKAKDGINTITYEYSGKSAIDTIEVFGRPRTPSINPNCPNCNGTGKITCSRFIKCTTCSGTGELRDHTCRECEGTGKVRTALKLWMGRRTCPDCKGRGSIYKTCGDCHGLGKEKCPNCKGTGKAVCPTCNK